MSATQELDESGFCSKCGIFRQDVIVCEFGSCGEYIDRRVAITDCPCTAVRYGHAKTCRYTVACAFPVGLEGRAAHGQFPCEDCDCDCGGKP